MRYFIGVDVGTGSARAGIFDREGRLLGLAKAEIETWKYSTDYAEQSSSNIWDAVCKCVREIIVASGVEKTEIGGLGFDATCSLVVLDENFEPLPVNEAGSSERNIILWMDHRAVEEAQYINTFENEEVLRYVGGKISLEMEVPKLLWLKRHLPGTWRRAAHFFDLPDFLTFRATGSLTRSLCSTVCKWTYRGDWGRNDETGWDSGFLHRIGLSDLANDLARIGRQIRPMGEAVASGLTPTAAEEMGLPTGTPVGVSIIDAHAGGLGMLGMNLGETIDLNRRLALIGGTSSCHMAVSRDPRFIEGVWGPYFSAMFPGWWLNEGGQSVTGALVDFIITNHGAFPALQADAAQSGATTYEILNSVLERMIAGARRPPTEHLHVCPYFHGNRSPRNNPNLRGMVTGLSLSGSVEDLALLYLATIQAIAYGTRHIIETMNFRGYAIDTIFMCGGGTKNPVFLREHADITGCRLVLAEEPETVLVGSAILGAVAGGAYDSIAAAMQAMSRLGSFLSPNQSNATFHDAKYAVFQRLYDDQLAYAKIMERHS